MKKINVDVNVPLVYPMVLVKDVQVVFLSSIFYIHNYLIRLDNVVVFSCRFKCKISLIKVAYLCWLSDKKAYSNL